MELSEVKKAAALRQTVEYEGVQYYVTACIMRLENQQWTYYLELHDMEANSVTVAPIGKVKIVCEQRE